MNPRKIALIEQVSMIRDRKKQVYIFSLVTFVVVMILVVGAIKPSIETIVRLQSEIKAKEDTLSALEDKINALNSLSLQYAEFEETAKDFELLYPSNGDFSLFLANIETLADDENMILRSISFDDEVDPTGELEALEPMRINLQVEGLKEDLIPFLKKMEALPMYTVIDSISFSTDEVEDSMLSFSVTMHIYGIPEEEFYE